MKVIVPFNYWSPEMTDEVLSHSQSWNFYKSVMKVMEIKWSCRSYESSQNFLKSFIDLMTVEVLEVSHINHESQVNL